MRPRPPATAPPSRAPGEGSATRGPATGPATGQTLRPQVRGVALVNAILVVAALAAISVVLLVRAERAQERLALKATGDQIGAYLDAGQAQALAELAAVLDDQPDGRLRPGQGWDVPRQVPIDRGQMEWSMQDLQGRFNLAWLADEQDWGDRARAAFRRLALSEGLSEVLTERLIAAAGPDPLARASALGLGTAPELPLLLPRQLAGVARPEDGGAQALAALWPHLAALPPGTGWSVATAPLPVARALIPGPDLAGWEAFALARLAGAITDRATLLAFAGQSWPAGVVAELEALPLADGTRWLELRLQARLDSQTRGRSAVLSVDPPDGAAPPGARVEPRLVLSVPMDP